MATWGINWSVFNIFILVGVGMIVAGFLVPQEARTDDGLPMKTFLWAFGSFWLVMDLALILVIKGMRKRKQNILENWMRGTARVISASETGTYINNMPKVKFVLEVTTDAHGTYQAEHREVVSMLQIPSYAAGSSHEVRVNPDNPKKIMFAD